MVENRMDNDRKQGTEPGRDDAREADLANRLSSLDKRLASRRGVRGAEAEDAKPDNSGFAAAMRLSSEFIGAIVVGAAVGYGIDRFFGVAPWGMIFFLLIGFCAGTLNVMRSSGSMMTRQEPRDTDRTDR